MTQRPRRRLVALILSLVPGWGHVYWGREIAGLAVFTLAAVLGFAWLNGRFIYRGDGREVIVWTAGSLALTLFAGVWIDLFLRTSPARCERESEARAHLLHQGAIAYLKSDFRKAALLFLECLRIDPRDVDALFRLGVTFAREGDAAAARKWLRRTRRHDLDGKWSWEVRRELRLIERRSETEAAGAQAAPVVVEGEQEAVST